MRFRSIRRLLVSFLGVILVGVGSLESSSAAMVLYGATAAGLPGELYLLDATTGLVLQDVGPLNDANGLNFGISGLAFHPITGVLYGSTHNLSTADPATQARLVTIDPTTARVTVIGAFNAGNTGNRPATMADIAFDANGTLYGVGSVGGPQIYSIDTATGQATVIGLTGLTSTSGGGIAISATGTIYGTPTATRFGTYDPATGAYTNIANPVKPLGGAYAALAFGGENETLFGLNLGPSPALETRLVTIEPSTGAVSEVGASVVGLDAIAFIPVPESSSVMFVTMGAIWLTRRRREAAGLRS